MISECALEQGIKLPTELLFNPLRRDLYSCEELMEGWSPGAAHSVTLDGRIYASVKQRKDDLDLLAQRIHDHAIDRAVARFVAERPRVVGIMGSSRSQPTDGAYEQVAHLARLLTRAGFLVASGGGLGIMEAANLGAFLAGCPQSDVDRAISELGQAPAFDRDDDAAQAAYLQAAVAIRERHAPGSASLAIPTWVYSGEPISQFASAIAKYFANSIREDGLLAVALSGVVFAEGRAGTTQEIFQDAAQNAYTDPPEHRSPMVFLGRQNYTTRTGLYETLKRQSELWGPYPLELVDTPDDVVTYLTTHQPSNVIERAAGADPAQLLALIAERARHPR
jgi:predicted Rossmann-fold nucleotide-binding protein